MQEWKREEGRNYPEPVDQVAPLNIKTPKDAVRELKVCERDEIPAVIRQALRSIQTWYGWHQVWVNFDPHSRDFPRSAPFKKIALSVMREAYAEHDKSGKKGLWDRRRIWNVSDRYALTDRAQNCARQLPIGGMERGESTSPGKVSTILRVIFVVAGIVILCGGGSFGFNWFLFGYEKAIEAMSGGMYILLIPVAILVPLGIWYFVVAFLEESSWGRFLVTLLMVVSVFCILYGCEPHSSRTSIYFWIGVIHLWVTVSMRFQNGTWGRP